jgi:hypothetical protein
MLTWAIMDIAVSTDGCSWVTKRQGSVNYSLTFKALHISGIPICFVDMTTPGVERRGRVLYCCSSISD